MTGLKSGSGDDLWGDDGQDGESEDPDPDEAAESATPRPGGVDESAASEPAAERDRSAAPDSGGGERSTTEAHPYIVRRALEDKSVQFERDERLTFFVHDDVAEGERELRGELESTLGRDVPKFDLREAVYRAALRNREAVLEELLAMGYSVDEE